MLLIVGVGVVPARAALTRVRTALQDKFGTSVPIKPVTARASSSARGQPAEKTIDGFNNRSWAPAGQPVGAWVEVQFSQPVRLLQITVTPGVSPQPEKYFAQGRAHQLDVTVNDGRGDVVARTSHTLLDQPGPQAFTVKASHAQRVRFSIAKCLGVQRGRTCAIAELEFRARV